MKTVAAVRDELIDIAKKAAPYWVDAMANEDFPTNPLGTFQVVASPTAVLELLASLEEMGKRAQALIDKVIAEDALYDDGRRIANFEETVTAHNEVCLALDGMRDALGTTHD